MKGKPDIKSKSKKKMGEMSRKLATGAKNMDTFRRSKSYDMAKKIEEK